jgi:uroporphyrinogen-III decarboxylase
LFPIFYDGHLASVILFSYLKPLAINKREWNTPGGHMNKKERFQAVRERRAPDRIPVWSCALSQTIFGQGLLLPDVIGQDWYDSGKITDVILKSIKSIDYDLAIPFYVDFGFGVPALGGKFDIPNKFGVAATTTDDQPVKTKDDWPEVQKKLATFDVRNTDPRMKGALEAIKNVSKAVGDTMPFSTGSRTPITTLMLSWRTWRQIPCGWMRCVS